MKSREFLKIAEACRDSFVSGIKKVFGIKSSSSSCDPKPKTGFNKEIMRKATEDAMKAHPETTTLGWEPENKSSKEAMDSFMQMAEAMSAVKHSFDEVGMQAQELIQSITEYNSFADEMNRVCRKETNNWKKMHGLPMKRRTVQERRKGKQNDITGNVRRIQ